jgi:MraZ protein
MRFYGQYLQRLDEKHRVVVPRKLREMIGEAELRNGLFITRGFDNCLFLFPASQWESVAAEISAVHFTGFDARMVQRMFFSEAVEVQPDKLGRVPMPEPLRQLAGIEEEVLFIGTSDRIELWSPSRWAALKAKHDPQYEEFAQALYQVLASRQKNQ